jgi:hypothetical protein
MGHPVSELRDTRVRIDSVVGVSASGLAEDVLATTAFRQRLAFLEAVLAGYFAKVEPVVCPFHPIPVAASDHSLGV